MITRWLVCLFKNTAPFTCLFFTIAFKNVSSYKIFKLFNGAAIAFKILSPTCGSNCVLLTQPVATLSAPPYTWYNFSLNCAQMPEGKRWLPSMAETPAADSIPPSQVVGSVMMVATPIRAHCMPAAVPPVPPPITNTSVCELVCVPSLVECSQQETISRYENNFINR